MKKLKNDGSEQKCSACNGTGFPAVKQPARPGRKIYPPPCQKCKGMGRIRIVAKMLRVASA
jgi:DnaJ-class molecular chaperone